jgi:hypothetical protein
MNSKTNITVTLTRKEAECLRLMADYGINHAGMSRLNLKSRTKGGCCYMSTPEVTHYYNY